MWENIIGQAIGSFIGVLAGYMFMKWENNREKKKKQNFIGRTKKSLKKYLKDAVELDGEYRETKRTGKMPISFLDLPKGVDSRAIEIFLCEKRNLPVEGEIDIFTIEGAQLLGSDRDRIKFIQENLATEIYDDEIYDILKTL